MKRFLDFVIAAVGLLALCPVLVIAALAIKLNSPGPVFHRGERAGKDGRAFRIFKFRTMVSDASGRGPGITRSEDPRVTRIGRLLRKTKLDELPQMLNVLRGEMSLVGPRPEDPRFVAHYTPEQRRILGVRPGITSPASLHYRDESRLLAGEEWERVYLEDVLPRKLAIDLEYIEHSSPWTDLGVLARTLGVLFR